MFYVVSIHVLEKISRTRAIGTSTFEICYNYTRTWKWSFNDKAKNNETLQQFLRQAIVMVVFVTTSTTLR